MLINKKWILIAGLFGFTGVALGAFGAHIISDKISENLYETYKTGVLYHLIHTLIIAVIGFSSYKEFNISGFFFSAGIILFSFSLYIYSITDNKIFAMITPIGGISFLIGWGLFIWKTFSKKI
ncbi:MAG TPA: DUF423 domain-containing protein [Ignavibacteriaceae bacterium]|nr:DUF423 domain-containing protein [Ignavibacteriaceae bacterium]